MRGAIVDLDGTVYVGGELLPGARSGVTRLREAGLSVLFFSNNPVMGGETYVERLQSMGIDAREGEACSSGDVTVEALNRRHADETVLVVGSDGLREQLETAGIAVTDRPDEADVLLASWSAAFDYESMRRALAAVDEDTPFYGTDPDRTFQSGTDEVVPGSGAIIGAVSATIGRDADAIFGKPARTAQRVALERLDLPPEDCLVVGDRLDTDLEMGRRAGMTTVLVSTGVTDPGDVADASFEPDHVLDSLGDIDRVLADADVDGDHQ